jgi:hypothetical protein
MDISFISYPQAPKRHVLTNGWTIPSFRNALLTRNNGTRCISDDHIEAQCLYYNQGNGNRCGVGCFIPDSFQGVVHNLWASAAALLRRHRQLVDVMPLQPGGLSALQDLHDIKTGRVTIADANGMDIEIMVGDSTSHDRFEFFIAHFVEDNPLALSQAESVHRFLNDYFGPIGTWEQVGDVPYYSIHRASRRVWTDYVYSDGSVLTIWRLDTKDGWGFDTRSVNFTYNNQTPNQSDKYPDVPDLTKIEIEIDNSYHTATATTAAT